MHGLRLPPPKMITFQTKLNVHPVVNVTVLPASALVKKVTLDLLANVQSAPTHAMATELVNLLPKSRMIFLTTQMTELLRPFLLFLILILTATIALVPKIQVLDTTVHGMHHAPKDVNVTLDTVDQTAH